MSQVDVVEILLNISYKPGWVILDKVDAKRGNARYIQLEVDGTCAVTGEPATWRSAKRYLSEFVTEQEVVGTVFGLIKDAEEHEMREVFRYKGRSIFNPHLDVSALAELASKKVNFDYRENSMREV